MESEFSEQISIDALPEHEQLQKFSTQLAQLDKVTGFAKKKTAIVRLSHELAQWEPELQEVGKFLLSETRREICLTQMRAGGGQELDVQ
ncbi:MAG: hypothetical protein H6765_06155 [Candidatus Peribacteria bacterium]|nr:MAG: hypothetical protein H6765_06155 [Candidatus Peribacteria bacterium]